MPAMAQSFHKANKTIAPSKPDALNRPGRRRRVREIGEVWGDRTRGHPALISSQDWPGTPYDAGRTRLGPSQYIASQQSRDLSTTVSINLPLIPSILRHRPPRAPFGADAVRRATTPTGTQCRTLHDPQRPLHVCAVRRRRFPVGASPTRRTLQPEATGAVMEVTEWLRPSV